MKYSTHRLIAVSTFLIAVLLFLALILCPVALAQNVGAEFFAVDVDTNFGFALNDGLDSTTILPASMWTGWISGLPSTGLEMHSSRLRST